MLGTPISVLGTPVFLLGIPILLLSTPISALGIPGGGRDRAASPCRASQTQGQSRDVLGDVRETTEQVN